MSGTAPNTINLNILPIGQDLIPRAAEGSKGCSLQIYWQNIFNIVPTFPIVATINLLMQYNTGQFTTIQAVWIDNSTVPYPVTLTAVETQQAITVPAFFQGMYPIFASTAPVFTASLNIYPDPNYGMSIGACTTKFIFLNTPQRYFEKYSPIIAPFQYTNNLVLTSTTPVAMGALGPGGIGFAATGTPTNYFRFFAADFTINLLSVASAAGVANVTLRESGHSSVPFIRAIMEWVNATTSIGLVFGRQFTFPDGGLLQMDPLNSWFLMFSGAGMPASGIVVTCNINGEAVTIA